MTNNNPTGRIIRIIIIAACIVNILVLASASRRSSASQISAYTDRSDTAATASTVKEEEIAATQEEAAEAETTSDTAEESDNDADNDENSGTPSITLSDDLPDLTQDDLDDIVPVLREADAISADDGKGNDITDDIRAVTTADLNDLGKFTINFSVENSDGETAQASADVTVDITKPILELSEYQVDLDRDADFEQLSYVTAAVDENGSDLSRAIHIDGDVDTSKSGTYKITYSIRSRVDKDKTAQKTLTVTVK